jgi:hypothetical protein
MAAMVWPRARPNVLHPRQYGGINLERAYSIYHAESAGSRDQPRPGSFLKKREEPGNEVGMLAPLVGRLITKLG